MWKWETHNAMAFCHPAAQIRSVFFQRLVKRVLQDILIIHSHMCPALQFLRETGGDKKKRIKRKKDLKIWGKLFLDMSEDVGVQLKWISITNHFCPAYAFSPDFEL